MKTLLLLTFFLGQSAMSLTQLDYTPPSSSVDVNQIVSGENGNSIARELFTKRLADLNLLKSTISELQTSLQNINTGDSRANKVESAAAITSLAGHLYAGIQYITGDSANAFHFRYLANFLALITAGISTTNSNHHNPNTHIGKVDELLSAIDQLKKHTDEESLKKAYREVESTLLDLRSDLSATQSNIQANQAYTFIWASNAFTLGKSNFLFNVVSLSAYVYIWNNLVTNLNRPMRFRLERQLNHILRQLDFQSESINLKLRSLN